MFLLSLVCCSMRLGVPFIAPRKLGAVGDQFGRPFLPSVEWCTGPSGAPPDSHGSGPVLDLLTNRAQPIVAPRVRLAHQTLSGAHRTVRCALPTVGARHASPADCAADRWRWRRWLIGQSMQQKKCNINAIEDQIVFAYDLAYLDHFLPPLGLFLQMKLFFLSLSQTHLFGQIERYPKSEIEPKTPPFSHN
jgi:hypothetical protein